MRRCVDGRDYMRDDGVVRREEGYRRIGTFFGLFWLAGSQPYPPGHYVPTSGII